MSWRVSSSTQEQRQIASALGLQIGRASKRIAGAMILDRVGIALDPSVPPTDPTPVQQDLADELSISLRGKTRRVAFAMIADEIARCNAEALDDLGLEPGDLVRYLDGTPEGPRDAVFEVSSIGRDGRVYFRGGAGHSAAPVELERA